MKPRRIVFFDLETTGVDIKKDEIIQIAAVAVDGDLNEHSTFEVKLHPSHDGRQALIRMKASGFPSVYSQAVWEKEGLPTRVGFDKFATWLRLFPFHRQSSSNGGSFWVAQLAGHNAARFDGEFLFRVAKEQGIFLPASYHVLDTLQLALWTKTIRGLDFESLKLGNLAAHFEVPLLDAHEAMADVRATIGIAKALIMLQLEVDP